MSIVRTKDEMIQELLVFGKDWIDSKINNDSMYCYFAGRFHGAAMGLVWAGVVTVEEYDKIERDLKLMAGVE